MRILPMVAAFVLLLATPALAGLEHSPESRGVRGASVDTGERDRDASQGEKRDGGDRDQAREWDRRDGGDGRR